MAFSSITEETLAELGNGFDRMRMRANLLLSGQPAYSEDGFQDCDMMLGNFRIDKWRHRIVCMVTTVVPGDNRIDTKPLQGLNTKRGRNGAAAFGNLFSLDIGDDFHDIQIGDTIHRA